MSHELVVSVFFGLFDMVVVAVEFLRSSQFPTPGELLRVLPRGGLYRYHILPVHTKFYSDRQLTRLSYSRPLFSGSMRIYP